MTELTATWRLARLALRRDRVKLSITITCIGIFVAALTTGVHEIFATEAEMRRGAAFLSANPAMRLFGLPNGAEMGNLMMLRGFTMISIIVALISTFTVIRHTRQNEELGRSELIGSHVVGRHAGLMAALIVAAVANLALSVLIYAGLVFGGLPAGGSLAMAIAVGLVGLAFAGFAAVAAQLTQTSRSANSIAAAGVILSFMLSGIGSVLGRLKPSGVEVEAAWPIWFTPIGWAQMIRPFADENWWMLLLFAGFFIGCITAAVVLANKRDVGSSIFAARPGRAFAQPGLLSLMGLTWRLQKNVFFGWLIGISLLSIVYGVVANDIDKLLSQAEGIAEIFVGATGSEEILLAYFGSIVNVLAIFVLAYAVSVSLRLKSEEDRALEFLLSTSLSRTKWALAHIGFLLGSITFMLLTAGFLAGLAAETVMGGSIDILWQVIAGALLHIPAIALLVGVVICVFGILPRYTGAVAWGAVAISIVLGPFFSSLLHLPAGVANISPLTHTPVVPPTDNIELLPLFILSAIATGLMLTGLLGFKRRDISTA